MKVGGFLLKGFLLFLSLILIVGNADAQFWKKKKKQKETNVQTVSDSVPAYTIAYNRRTYHDKVDKAQLSLLSADGKADNLLAISKDSIINKKLTTAATKEIDRLQYVLETSTILDARLKAVFLEGFVEILKFIKSTARKTDAPVNYLPEIVDTYKKLMLAYAEKKSIAPIIEPLSYDIGNTALMPKVFNDNPGYEEALVHLTLKVVGKYPERTFSTLRLFPDVPFADSLIRIVAHKSPELIYDYAQANNKLSYRIQNIVDDPFITTVVAMARNPNKSGQYYFPFLDNIVKGKIKMEDIDRVKNDPVKYFRLLVKTQIDYTSRMLNGDTAVGAASLVKKIGQKAKDDFVAKINGLHEFGYGVRFRSIQDLNAEELYYVAVLTDGLLYTSSYTDGVFPIMMRKAGNRGDELLKKVNFDHYRKFISQAAAYNTFKEFLGTFKVKSDANDLMKAFVTGLEKSEGLEDGVDVADSYASVAEVMPELAKDMLVNVKTNLDRNIESKDANGIAIYDILYKLFLSADTANKVDLTTDLGIPPVYNVPFSSLTNEKGDVICQVFFYGDSDGRKIFNGFLNMFGGANWKIDASNKQWVLIKSTKGKPVYIYANRPLDENKGLDDKAQRALNAYLQANDLEPTITIHRGHSYYAESTIKYMAPSSKVVFMGSCGGFNLIDQILKKSDDAHIIASKQIGRTSINKPFFYLLTDKLRAGDNIDWIPFWKEFKKRANVAGFEDYIPPYKNLGAIFIKAYKMETGETDV